MGMCPGHFQRNRGENKTKRNSQMFNSLPPNCIYCTWDIEIVVKAPPLHSSFGVQMNAFYCRTSLKAGQYSSSSFTFKSVIWLFGFH